MNLQIGTSWLLCSKCKHKLDICTHSWLSLHCYGSLPPLVSQWSPSFPTFCGSQTCRAWGSGGRRDVQLGLSSCADSSPTRTADVGCWWQRTNMCWSRKKELQTCHKRQMHIVCLLREKLPVGFFFVPGCAQILVSLIQRAFLQRETWNRHSVVLTPLAPELQAEHLQRDGNVCHPEQHSAEWNPTLGATITRRAKGFPMTPLAKKRFPAHISLWI